jgi:hypothetical protein
MGNPMSRSRPSLRTKIDNLKDKSAQLEASASRLNKNGTPSAPVIDIKLISFSNDDKNALTKQLKAYAAQSTAVTVTDTDMNDLAKTEDFKAFTAKLENYSIDGKKTKHDAKMHHSDKVKLNLKPDYLTDLFGLVETGNYAEFKRKWDICKHHFMKKGIIRNTYESIYTFIETKLDEVLVNYKEQVKKGSAQIAYSASSAKNNQVVPARSLGLALPTSTPNTPCEMTPRSKAAERVFLYNTKNKLNSYLKHLNTYRGSWFYNAEQLNTKIAAVETLTNATDVNTYNAALLAVANTLKQHRAATLFGCIPVGFFASCFGTKVTGKTLVDELDAMERPRSIRLL